MGWLFNTFSIGNAWYVEKNPAQILEIVKRHRPVLYSDLEASLETTMDISISVYDRAEILQDISRIKLLFFFLDVEIRAKAAFKSLVIVAGISDEIDQLYKTQMRAANDQVASYERTIGRLITIRNVSTRIVTAIIQKRISGPIGNIVAAAYSGAIKFIGEEEEVRRGLKDEIDFKSMGIQFVLDSVVNYVGGKAGDKLAGAVLGTEAGKAAANALGKTAVEAAVNEVLSKTVGGPIDVVAEVISRRLKGEGSMTWGDAADIFLEQFSKEALASDALGGAGMHRAK